MRPLVLEKCWICTQEFPDKKLLKKHLASKSIHGGRLSVICLWCFKYEKRFTRVNDLKTHVEEKHQIKNMDPKFLTEANAYWYSIYAEDYRKLITRVTPKSTDIAVKARQLVTEWLTKCHSIKKTHNQWIKDWANHPRDEEEKMERPAREPSVASDNGHVSDWEFQEPHIDLEEYNPLEPSLLSLHHISLSSHPIRATFKVSLDKVTWYLVMLDPVLKEVEKYYNIIKRKASLVTPKKDITMSKSGKSLEGEELEEKKKAVSELLGIPKPFICSVSAHEDLFTCTTTSSNKIQQPPVTVSKPPAAIPTTPATVIQPPPAIPVTSATVSPLQPATVIQPPPAMPVTPATVSPPTPATVSQPQRTTPATVSPLQPATVIQPPPAIPVTPATVSPPTPATVSQPQPTTPATVSAPQPAIPVTPATVIQPPPAMPVTPATVSPPSPAEPVSTISTPSVLTESDENQMDVSNPQQENSHIISSQDTHSQSNIPSIPKRKAIQKKKKERPEITEGQRKAKEILERGSMPAVPPARRNWSEIKVKFAVKETVVEWPPNGWAELSEDRKLLAWEFAASTLEKAITGQFPRLERFDLLDKYNFLALPGTKEPKLKSKDNIIRKCRYYNYEVLRTAFKQPSPDQDLLINQLYATTMTRDISTDKLIDRCTMRNIPLRL